MLGLAGLVKGFNLYSKGKEKLGKALSREVTLFAFWKDCSHRMIERPEDAKTNGKKLGGVQVEGDGAGAGGGSEVGRPGGLRYSGLVEDWIWGVGGLGPGF